jgi:nucleoid DNA-binding protein
MAADLQKRGFSFRKASALVNAVFAAMTEALRRDEDVETPLGTFEVVYGPGTQTRERFGKPQMLFRNHKRLRFRPAPEFERALAPGNTKEGKAMNSSPKHERWRDCPRCGGTSFTEQEFRQYRGGIASSAPGGDISPDSEQVIQALVCLCGAVLPPPKKGSQNRDAYKSFVSCCAAALAHREMLAEHLMAALHGRFASAEQLQLFIERLDADGEIVKLLKTK